MTVCYSQEAASTLNITASTTNIFSSGAAKKALGETAAGRFFGARFTVPSTQTADWTTGDFIVLCKLPALYTVTALFLQWTDMASTGTDMTGTLGTATGAAGITADDADCFALAASITSAGTLCADGKLAWIPTAGTTGAIGAGVSASDRWIVLDVTVATTCTPITGGWLQVTGSMVKVNV